MAGIVSATQRQSFAFGRAVPATLRDALKAAYLNAKSDRLRALCLASALVLALLGLFAPHVESIVLTSTLLVLGSMLATVAARGCVQPTPAIFQAEASSVDKKDRVSASSRAKILGELLHAARRGVGDDVEHWCNVTSRMSHELRTPLNAVLGFSELMKGEVFGPLGSQQYADYARSIHKSGRTLLKSAEDALAITSLLTRAPALGNEAASSLMKGVNDAIDFHGLGLEDLGIGVVLGVDPTLDVSIEAQTLRQILINLIAEAMDRAGEGSCIAFESESFLLEGSLRISVSQSTKDEEVKPQVDSFALILSRTLAQFCGARLDEESTNEVWAVSVHFPRAVQRDFFAHVGH